MSAPPLHSPPSHPSFLPLLAPLLLPPSSGSSPGVSVHQNGGYSWHPMRSWGDTPPIDDGDHDANVAAFGRYWRRAWAQEFASVDYEAYAPPVRDTIVVMNRPVNTSRHLANFKAVVEGLLSPAGLGGLPVVHGTATGPDARSGYTPHSNGGLPSHWRVVDVEMEAVPDEALFHLMQRAVVFIGVHGAGLTSMLLMQGGGGSGGIIVEMIPQKVEVGNYFATLALSLDHDHHSIPLDVHPTNGWDGPFTVHVPTVRGKVDITLRKYRAQHTRAHHHQSARSGNAPPAPLRAAARETAATEDDVADGSGAAAPVPHRPPPPPPPPFMRTRPHDAPAPHHNRQPFQPPQRPPFPLRHLPPYDPRQEEHDPRQPHDPRRERFQWRPDGYRDPPPPQVPSPPPWQQRRRALK